MNNFNWGRTREAKATFETKILTIHLQPATPQIVVLPLDLDLIYPQHSNCTKIRLAKAEPSRAGKHAQGICTVGEPPITVTS